MECNQCRTAKGLNPQKKRPEESGYVKKVTLREDVIRCTTCGSVIDIRTGEKMN